MTVLVDTSILIDYLRGCDDAAVLLEAERRLAEVHGSEISRLEVLSGMRPDEERSTRLLLSVLRWHPVNAEVAERAGELGCSWLPSHHGIDAADLAIAATALLLGARLLTRNIKHFPMIEGLTSPY